MLEKGKIDSQAQPADVYKMQPVFQKFSLNVFRQAFNKAKAKTGLAHEF